MKVILSRKGFDSANGGCPSPIMPNNTLLSLPIPADDGVAYEELSFRGINYADLLSQLNPRRQYTNCHLDPDIRESIRLNGIANWKPAFGQIGSAQGLLSNAKVDIGDLFLFFGWFRQVEQSGGKYRYVRKTPADFYRGSDLHVIYGYMQIGDIITDPTVIESYYWHPHSSNDRLYNTSNTLYIPSDSLSFLPVRKGYGVLAFRKDRVLTMEGQNRGTWNNLSFLRPEHIYGNKKNSANGSGLYYSGIWQELVVFESDGLIEWAKSIIE